MNRNLARFQIQREIDEKVSLSFQRGMQINDSIIKRLGCIHELQGHSGCVNCLEWNDSGSLLASGSDDCQIILWNPFLGKKVKCIQSGHQGNIFSVKLLKNNNQNTILSCAADSRIRVHDLIESETIMDCSCHSARVKRLAVAPKEPFMFWSAAEDGLILQYDLREPHWCRNNICNNVLINLISHIGPSAEAKCIVVNPRRPELLAVGANDPYIRLYDRRMISTTTFKTDYGLSEHQRHWRNINTSLSCNDDENIIVNPPSNLPSKCATYFVAAHLPNKLSEYRKKHRALACTYIAFSPSGNELLANLGGEQIYLFDIAKPERPKCFDINSNGLCKGSRIWNSNGYHINTRKDILVDNDLQNKDNSNKDADKKTNTTTTSAEQKTSSTTTNSNTKSKFTLPKKAENLKKLASEKLNSEKYSLAIKLYNELILMCPNVSEFYVNRASAYIKRRWDGDVYCALKDFFRSLELDGGHFKTHWNLAQCLYDLRWYKEAYECLEKLKEYFPDQTQAPRFLKLESDIRYALNLTDTSSSSSSKSDSDKLNEDSEDSSNNKRFKKFDHLSDQEIEWRALAYDFKRRYCGHCNVTTDIKEANFFGNDGQYIVAGSDDGSFFIWDRQTTNIVQILAGDSQIVNCLQPHPTHCLLATSGIDPLVRLWSPKPEDGHKNERVIMNWEEAAAANQKHMNENPFDMLFNMEIASLRDADSSEARDVLQCRAS